MEQELKKLLKQIHDEKKINYTYFANELGISRQMLYRWTLDENNKEYRKLSASNIERLKNTLKKFL